MTMFFLFLYLWFGYMLNYNTVRMSVRNASGM